jgi:hypothetical protein
MNRVNGVLAAALFASASVALALMASGASAAAPADDPTVTKPVEPAPASSKPDPPPMIIHNRDGTFTIQKEPPKGTSDPSKAKNGLVIPPQVVVPLIPAPEKKP